MSLTPELRSAELEARTELAKLSNWGRWGDDDQRGALNLIDEAAFRRGALAATTGRVIALGAEIRASAMGMYHSTRPNAIAPKLLGVPQPLHFYDRDGGDGVLDERRRKRNLTEDVFMTQIHGVGTHVDGLAHVAIDGVMYNGVPGTDVRSYGARRHGMEHFQGVATRGVLLDVAALRGVACLEPDDYITDQDLQACLDRIRVELAPGDAVLIRTGWPSTYADDPTVYGLMQPGVGSSAALFLARHEVCLVGADNSEVEPFFELDPKWHREDARFDIYLTHASTLPEVGSDWRSEIMADLHATLLRNLGVCFLEQLDLEELATAGIGQFQLIVAPLRIRGASGSPVNPVAIV